MNLVPRNLKLSDCLWSIVVTILLSTVLLPAFSLVADRPDLRETCMKNTKAIGQALAAYASDHDEKLMQEPDNDWPFHNTGDGEFIAWGSWITPYLPSSSVLRCPAYDGPFPIPDFWGINRAIRQTYSINYRIVGTYDSGLGGSLGDIPNPASVVLAAETSSGISWFSGSDSWNLWTAADMIMHKARMHDVVKLAPDCSTAANRANCRNITSSGFLQRALPAMRARVTLLSADMHARSANMVNLLSRELDPQTGKVRQPFWSGLSGDPLATP